MKRDFNPVDVELSIENPSIERSAFYRLCFITESDIAPRTLKVTRLQDLLDNGYSRLDLVYNFCVGVFSQQGIDTVYIRAKRSSESYVESYNSDDNSMYYFVVLQTKNLTEIEIFNRHLVSSDEMKLQFFSQNVGSKILQSPKLVNYYQDYTRPEGGVSSGDRDYYLNKAYEGSDAWVKIPLPDYLVGGFGNAAIDYGVRKMVGEGYIWEIDKPNRRIKYSDKVVESGWVGSRERSTINNSEVTVVATKGRSGKLLRASIKDPKVKIETVSRELLKGLGKEVLDYAIPLIDPEAKDWVLDPANNNVKYKDVQGSLPSDPSNKYYWVGTYGDKYKGSTAAEAGEKTGLESCRRNKFKDCSVTTVLTSEKQAEWTLKYNNGSTLTGYVSRMDNPNYNPDAPSGGDKYIPIDTVSQQVIENAESGHVPSQTFLKSIPLFAYLLTGSGTEAVDKAVLDIDAEATDWVLDPENNAIKYKDPNAGSDSGDGSWDDGLCVNGEGWGHRDLPNKYSTPEAACRAFLATTPFKYEGLALADSNSAWCVAVGAGHVDKVTKTGECEVKPKPDGYKSILIDTVAAKVIENAESGHAPSQEALRLSTVERVNIGEYDEALEAASTKIDTSWKYLPIYDVAVQVKRNSIAGHAESIEAVNNSLPFELPNYEPEVVILGDVLTGEVVVAEVSDRNRLPENVVYGWYSNDELVGSEKSYQIQDSDLGKTLRLAVTYTDLDGHLENVEVKSVVGKSTKKYWESGSYPIEITLEEIPEGLVVYEDFAVKTAPMDMTVSEIVKDDRLGDSYRGMVAPLDIYKDSLLKSRYETSDFKTSVEPLDITIVELIKTSREDLRYTVGLAPLDIENKEIAIHHKQSDGYKAEVIPLNIMINTEV